MSFGALQAANFVRSHWFWRKVAYPGGIIPASTIPKLGVDPEIKARAEALDMHRASVRNSVHGPVV